MTRDGVLAAGLRIRLLSGAIDGLLVSTTFTIVTFGIVHPLSERFDVQNAFVVAKLAARLGVPAELLAGTPVVIIGALISLLLPMGLIVSTAVFGQTPGKRLLGLRVVTNRRMLRPGLGRAVARKVIPLLVPIVILLVLGGTTFLLTFRPSTESLASLVGLTWISLVAALLVVPGVMYLSVAWGQNKRGWIERMTGTRVLNIRAGADPYTRISWRRDTR